MPSKLPQLNVRLSAAEMELLADLGRRLAEERGVPHSQADTVRAAMHALQRQLKEKTGKTNK